MKSVRISLQVLVILVSVFCLVWVNNTVYFTAGSLIGTIAFGMVLLCAVFYKKLFSLIRRLWDKLFGRIVLIAVGAVLTFAVGLCSYFTVQMIIHIEKPLDDVKCVMVLGCQVVGEVPSYMLADRLDRSITVLNENPDTVCIVTGGQGRGEAITEAEAMRRYLVRRGISPDRIYIEDRATSTAENFRNSTEILAQLGISDGVAVVTSDFHQYRASLYAKRYGLQTGHYSATTSVFNLLNNWIRECAALLFV